MPFNPKREWENTKQFMGGDTRNITAPRLIQMTLTSGRLGENDEENVSVFASHLKKVLNNHQPTDREVINDIELREAMRELEVTPLVGRVHLCQQRVYQRQGPRTQWIPPKPPNAFMSMSEENLRHHFDLITEFWEATVDFKEWHECHKFSGPEKWGPV